MFVNPHTPRIPVFSIWLMALNMVCVILISVSALEAQCNGAEMANVSSIAATESDNNLKHPAPIYSKLLWDDTQAVLLAPAYWDRGDWCKFSTDLLLVVGVGALMDPGIEGYVEDHNPRSVSRALKIVEPFGAEYSIGIIGAFYVFGVMKDNRTNCEVAEDGIAASILAGGIITPALKLLTGRARANIDGNDYDFRPFSGRTSFPSGHATEAFAVASVITEHYTQPWVSFFSYGIAVLVGVARVDHARHYTSDVVAGALIGSSVGKAVVHKNRCERSGLSFEPLVREYLSGMKICWRF